MHNYWHSYRIVSRNCDFIVSSAYFTLKKILILLFWHFSDCVLVLSLIFIECWSLQPSINFMCTLSNWKAASNFERMNHLVTLIILGWSHNNSTFELKLQLPEEFNLPKNFTKYPPRHRIWNKVFHLIYRADFRVRQDEEDRCLSRPKFLEKNSRLEK